MIKRLPLFYPVLLIVLVQVTAESPQAQTGGASAGEVRVVAVCLRAEDVPALARFYQQVLELEDPVVDFAGRTCFRLGEAVLFILQGQPRAPVSEDPFPLLAFSVVDLDAAHERLRTLGSKRPHGIEGGGRHRELQFYDPAGNLVELVQDRGE